MNYIYARRDTVAETFSPPIVAPSDELACRFFLLAFGAPGVIERKEVMYFRLGIFNDETGAIEGHDPVDLTDMVNKYFDDVLQFQKDSQNEESET